MNKTISIKEALSFGWKTFWANPWFWIIALLISVGSTFGGGSSAGESASESTTPDMYINRPTDLDSPTRILGTTDIRIRDMAPLTGREKVETPAILYVLGAIYGIPTIILILVVVFLMMVIHAALTMGYIHLTLDAVREKPLEYKTLLSDVSVKKALRFWWLNTLYALMVMFGFILLVIPGIYFMIKYSFANYFLIDQDLSAKDALKKSAEATQGIKLKLFGYYLLTGVIVVVGVLAFVVGVIPAATTVSIAYAYIYNELSGQSAQGQTELNAPVASAPQAV